MKNMLLAYAADWMVDAATLNASKDTWPAIKAFYEAEGDTESSHTPLRKMLKEPLKEIYSIPFLSDKFCALLLDEIAVMDFLANPDEDTLRQIPEIVLSEKLPFAHHSLSEIVKAVVAPILWELWQIRPTHAHIQVANYNPRDKRAGAWHHDQSADITIVVPLNTGKYSGGGTEFWNRGTVEPLPTGHALIFPSLTHLHRGLPVDSGDRFLLVFWLKAKHGKD